MFWRRVGPLQAGARGNGVLEQKGRQADEALGGQAVPHRHQPWSERAPRPWPAAKQKALQVSGVSGPACAAEKAASAAAPELLSGRQAMYSSPGPNRQAGRWLAPIWIPCTPPRCSPHLPPALSPCSPGPSCPPAWAVNHHGYCPHASVSCLPPPRLVTPEHLRGPTQQGRPLPAPLRPHSPQPPSSKGTPRRG